MSAGKLVLIATPIGNLEDLSPRAVRNLKESDLLLCEDTRVTEKLLRVHGIDVPMESFHEHNEEAKLERVLSLLDQGRVIGLVTDAGMPLLSDPGFPVVREAAAAGFTIEPLPGPFAGALALTVSAFPPVPFAFFGFIGRKRSERIALFERLRDLRMTTIFYESPRRIVGTLGDLGELYPAVSVTVAREMTKMHEEFLRGTPTEVADVLRERGVVKGEITLVVAPVEAAEREVDVEEIIAEFVRLRDRGMRRPDVARALAEKYRLSRREIYDLISEI